jgi:hypothetical protein
MHLRELRLGDWSCRPVAHCLEDSLVECRRIDADLLQQDFRSRADCDDVLRGQPTLDPTNEVLKERGVLLELCADLV